MTILQSGIAQAAAGGGYQIARSLRFNSADTAYLSRTPGSAGNRQKFTYSTWIKISSLASAIQRILGVGVTNYFGIDFGYSAGEFNINVDVGPDATRSQNYTTATFRDPSAWYHIVIAVDTTQATAANRLKIYVNNVLYSYTSTATIPQNVSTDVNNTVAHNIGRRVDGTDRYANTYMADIRLIDGQQLDPTSFGEYDASTGVWSPITYSGTYGTNGFWLKLDDNSNNTAATLGKDSSGNSNNWTPNNFSVLAGTGNDSLVDTPTNYGTDTGAGGEVRGNYATLNPLDQIGATPSDGNLQVGISNGTANNIVSTITMSSGKWYWEVKPTSLSVGGGMIGVADSASPVSQRSYGFSGGWYYCSDGFRYNAATGVAYGGTYATTDTIGVALDMDAGTVTFYKNGTSLGVAYSTGLAGKTLFAVVGNAAGGASQAYNINFGQRPFANTAPSGFKALCTQNLPTPAIGATSSTLASKNFNTVTWTGTGSGTSRSLTGVGFLPDFVWSKNRTGAFAHTLHDAVRGAGSLKALYSSSTASESGGDTNTSGYLSSFDSDGFTFTNGSGGTPAAYFNTSGSGYIGWAWNAGGATVTNTNGSISSQVRANPAAGISVVSFGTATSGTSSTVGHGLGVVPKMIILKYRNAVNNWVVHHAALGTGYTLQLNTTSAQLTNTTNVNATSSTTFTLGSSFVDNPSQPVIAYCFAEVAGFSRFGSYTGNGSTDGVFVYLGFRPRFIIIKNSGAVDSWQIRDTARNSYNQATAALYPNLSNAEGSDTGIDILSNGFKLRASTGLNALNNNFIFVAFAEAPFNYARAR